MSKSLYLLDMFNLMRHCLQINLDLWSKVAQIGLILIYLNIFFSEIKGQIEVKVHSEHSLDEII